VPEIAFMLTVLCKRAEASRPFNNLICRWLPFLETLYLMEDVASHLARYFSIAVRSAGLILWTAFSSVCCFVSLLLTSVRLQATSRRKFVRCCLSKWV